MSCGVGRRHDSYPALLWLWRRPVAAARIRPLAWEPPYAVGAAQEKHKKKKKKALFQRGLNSVSGGACRKVSARKQCSEQNHSWGRAD